MYTRAPSEVIHGRSFPAKSMICAVQLLMSKLDEVAPWHVIAATEICAARKGLLTGITNVVACSVPVEPKSTSASPPPNTTAYPALVRALSIGPCRFGVEPKSPVQSCVPKGNNQPNDVIAMKCPLNAISGSLLPAGNSNGVLENMRVPAVVPAINGSVIEADTAETAGAATALTMGLSAWVRLATPQKWAQLASNAGNPDIKTISPITGPCLKPWPEATGAGVQCILSP